jgi:serine/threonine protein kinase
VLRYNGGSLGDRIALGEQPWMRLSPRRVLRQLLSAVAYMQRAGDAHPDTKPRPGYAHYDIKPSNVMVCTRRVEALESNHYDAVLIDFSVAYELVPQSAEVAMDADWTVLGAFSEPYRPPECWMRERLYKSGEAADLAVARDAMIYSATACTWAVAATVADYQMGDVMLACCLPADAQGKIARSDPLAKMGELWGLPTRKQWPAAYEFLTKSGTYGLVEALKHTRVSPTIGNLLETATRRIVDALRVAEPILVTRRTDLPAKTGDPQFDKLSKLLYSARSLQFQMGKHALAQRCIEALLSEWNPRERMDAQTALARYFIKK